MSFTIDVAGQTDVGRVRDNNEDNFGYDSRHGIYVVCDGIGGQNAGEVASKIAVDTVLQYFRSPATTIGSPQKNEGELSRRANSLASAIRSANLNICDEAAAHPGQSGMGSTIVAVLVENGAYSVAHVGDSRVYLLRPASNYMRQLTNDHSLVMDRVRRGLLTLQEAQHSKIQNIILRALGSSDASEPDLMDLTAEPGDTLLLATDGLTQYVSDAEILRIIAAEKTLKDACGRLIAAANAGGGRDNITCLLLQFVEKP
jgi:protein phosphatase